MMGPDEKVEQEVERLTEPDHLESVESGDPDRSLSVRADFCRITGATGKFTSPTWSPDGKSLAWADRRGIWKGTLGSPAGASCEITRKLVIKHGTAPDWGPARP